MSEFTKPAEWELADATLKRNLEHPVEVSPETIKRVVIDRAINKRVLEELAASENPLVRAYESGYAAGVAYVEKLVESGTINEARPYVKDLGRD